MTFRFKTKTFIHLQISAEDKVLPCSNLKLICIKNRAKSCADVKTSKSNFKIGTYFWKKTGWTSLIDKSNLGNCCRTFLISKKTFAFFRVWS
ncbi:hypothetical protein L596_008578 [Steinernema carpocapsae]|uniref:Uncharacterized protein n=1 Tax=Steinernema carpocapsae TaxID=34508 RepID=A0A4U5PD70_STECR|nr:hypothetical protein L596_008578 [Steinernema carpocapsae]